MEKKDLIKVENAAIRAAGSRMAKMFQPMVEHEDDKEARRAFYEGFQEGAAYYRLLIDRIDDEFANLIEGVRLDSGSEEDAHSVMEMRMKNGIPVITAAQKAPGKKETEKLHEAVKKNLEFPIEQPKAKPDKKAEEPKGEAAQTEPDGYPLWLCPIDTIEKTLKNLGVKFERQGYENILYLRFTEGDVEYTIYFEKHEDVNYKVVFSDMDAHGGKVLWDGVIADRLTLMALEQNITEHVKGW